jgi:cytochrome c oxidase subunit 3
MALATPAATSSGTVAATAEATHGHAAHGHVPTYADTLANNRLGLWLFFISEAFLFGGLLAVRFYLWGDTRPEVSQFIGLIVTVVLLLSSISMYTAEAALENGNRRLFMVLLPVTALLGLVFLAGVMIFEWGLFPAIYEGHLTPWGDKYGAVVFLMTGMHALHVVSGIIFIGIVWNLARKGHFSPSRKWGVESCAIYWHYVDLVWIFFYPAIYLIGTAVAH